MKQSQLQSKAVLSEINWQTVENYLKNKKIIKSDSALQIKQFSAGYSNLTYYLKTEGWRGVLRRPPFGSIPEKAHDMKREYDILEKLNPVFPISPKPYLYCEDEEIMERHFYVMEMKEGIILDDSMPSELDSIEDAKKLISKAIVKTLVSLHEIDYKKAGLENLGYPEGYLNRQVNGWIKRYHSSKTDEIEGVEELEKWLLNHIPNSPEPTIVHNDFKLNNMMFSKDNPGTVVGLFDWELSTIGDPLTDVGTMIAYWEEDGEPFSGLTSITKNPGFASRKEMLEMYAQQSGRDISNFDFYLTFAFYKIAVILQQIYYRWKIGEVTDSRFGSLGEGVSNLMKQAQKAKNKEILK